jgi:hypothetical protein
VTASHAGEVRVRFDVLGPNPSILTGTASWIAPAACNPAPPAATSSAATTSAPTPTLAVSIINATNLSTDLCTSVTVNVSATLSVGSAPGGLDVTYTVSVDGVSLAPQLVHVLGSAPALGSVLLPGVTLPHSAAVKVVATAAGAPDASASVDYPITCTAT